MLRLNEKSQEECQRPLGWIGVVYRESLFYSAWIGSLISV